MIGSNEGMCENCSIRIDLKNELDQRLRVAVENYSKGDRGTEIGKVMRRLRQRVEERRKHSR